MIWEQFHFLRPWCFLLVLPLFFLIYHLIQSQVSLQSWRKLCDPALLAYLQEGSATKVSQLPLYIVGFVGCLLIIALAGPAWQQLPQPVYRAQSALIIALDLSQSMDAEDVQPSRLIRAKQKITDLLSLRNIGQTALVVFAGSAFTVTPLSDDKATVLLQLQGLDTSIMPAQGGNIDAALAKSLALLQQSSIKHGQVLLLTDSADYSIQAVQNLVQHGHQLHVIAVGTTLGAPIQQQSGGFVTDAQGNIILPTLDTARLQQLAIAGHGFYHVLSLDNADIQPLLQLSFADHPLSNRIQGADENNGQSTDIWREEAPWLLLLLLPLLLMGFRRGVLVIICCLYLQPTPAQASFWSDMWQSKHQQAQDLLQQQDYAQAAQTFTEPSWQAFAAYKNHDYVAANQAFEQLQTPTVTAMYNQANTLAHLGRFPEAIAMYDAVLHIKDDHDDARHNKALLEASLQQQEQQNQDDNLGESKQSESQSNAEQGEKKPSDDGQIPNDQGQTSNASQQQEQGEKTEASADEKVKDEGTDGSVATPTDTKEQAQQETSDDEKSPTTSSQQTPKPRNDTDKTAAEQQQAEQQQTFEYQLRRVPDDPARLLRNKFKYQYQQQRQNKPNTW